MASQSKVYFFFDTAHPKIKKSGRLKSAIETLFADEEMKLVRLNYVFCDDETLLSINRQFLRHDYYTDIVTFNLSNDPGTIDAEAYISLERVKENAFDLKVPFEEELMRVIFHGALHLCGYKDKTSKQRLQMREKEKACLSRMA